MRYGVLWLCPKRVAAHNHHQHHAEATASRCDAGEVEAKLSLEQLQTHGGGCTCHRQQRGVVK